MTMQTGQSFIQREEARRDLRHQLGNLAADEESEIQFTEWSPGRKLVTIWNMQTGEEALLPRYQAIAAVNSPNPRGGYMWTSHRFGCDCGRCSKETQAPKARVNTVKCFLHPDSPERVVLDEIGVSTVCMSEHLASNPSKWAHARNRHPSAFGIYQEEIGRRENEDYRSEQRRQTDAMLQLATGVSQKHGGEWLDAMNSPVTAAAVKGAAAGLVSRAEEKIHLAAMSNRELRDLAAERGVDVHKAVNKAQLVAALEDGES